MLIYLKRLIQKIIWAKKTREMKCRFLDASASKNLIINGAKYISIGRNFHCSRNVTIDSRGGEIIIGDNVTINNNCDIACLNKIEICDGVLLGTNVFITDNYHGDNSRKEIDIIPQLRKLYSKGPVRIGRNVWIGRNVCIMPNVTIGDGTIIGANAVVTKDCEPYSIYAGVPAKLIRRIK